MKYNITLLDIFQNRYIAAPVWMKKELLIKFSNPFVIRNGKLRRDCLGYMYQESGGLEKYVTSINILGGVASRNFYLKHINAILYEI